MRRNPPRTLFRPGLRSLPSLFDLPRPGEIPAGNLHATGVIILGIDDCVKTRLPVAENYAQLACPRDAPLSALDRQLDAKRPVRHRVGLAGSDPTGRFGSLAVSGFLTGLPEWMVNVRCEKTELDSPRFCSRPCAAFRGSASFRTANRLTKDRLWNAPARVQARDAMRVVRADRRAAAPDMVMGHSASEAAAARGAVDQARRAVTGDSGRDRQFVAHDRRRFGRERPNLRRSAASGRRRWRSRGVPSSPCSRRHRRVRCRLPTGPICSPTYLRRPA